MTTFTPTNDAVAVEEWEYEHFAALRVGGTRGAPGSGWDSSMLVPISEETARELVADLQAMLEESDQRILDAD